MVSIGKARLYRRKDGKYLIYLSKDFAEDTAFPFKGSDSIFLKATFEVYHPGQSPGRIILEPWKEQ